MSVRVLVKFANPTMRITAPILDRDGRPIAGCGSFLRERLVRVLREIGVRIVSVEDTQELAPWEKVQDVEEQLAGVERRFARTGDAAETAHDAPRAMLKDAIVRHVTKEAAEFSDIAAERADEGAA